MILEAATRSAASASPMPYMNKILSDWKQAGIYATKDIPSAPVNATANGAVAGRFTNPVIEAVNAKSDRERYYALLREKAQTRAERFLSKANANARFKEITAELSKMEISLAKAEVFEPVKLPQLQEQKQALLVERKKILSEMGIEERELSPQFTCKKCSDTGFLPSGAACNCYTPGA